MEGFGEFQRTEVLRPAVTPPPQRRGFRTPGPTRAVFRHAGRPDVTAAEGGGKVEEEWRESGGQGGGLVEDAVPLQWRKGGGCGRESPQSRLVSLR